MDSKDYKKFYLIREDVLPESVVKTLKIKDALKNDATLSIYEAVKQFNLSRSAFYKYRDTIFPVDEKIFEHREFTLILYVNDIVGMLAQVLQTSVIRFNYSSKCSNGRKSNDYTLFECKRSIIINRKGHGHFEKYSTCL